MDKIESSMLMADGEKVKAMEELKEILASAEKYSAEQNFAEAAKLWKMAAEQGDAEAQDNLGSCYEYGNGVAQDYAEAYKWYSKAAEQGNANAQYDLGFCYEYGNGVAQDYTEAYKWYKEAAEQGHDLAQCDLGGFYYNGKGVVQDYGEACKWYRKAAEQGNMYAQYNIGICYEYGRGVEQNFDEAEKWNQKAAEQGYEMAIQRRPRRTEFEIYVEKCKDFLQLICRMPESWNAKNGELNTHEGRGRYSEFMNNLVGNLDTESYFANILYDNMRNLNAFTQIMFSRYKKLRIAEIYMNGDPDYGLNLKVSSNLSITWNENESNTLKKEFEKNICEPLMSLDFSVERMETDSFEETYTAYQSFGLLGIRLGTYQCLFEQFFDSLLEEIDRDDALLDEVITLFKQHPIVYSKDLETAFIWEYKFKDPYIEIEIPYPNLIEEYQNKKSKHHAFVYLEDYETTIVLIHFKNMPISNYTAHYYVEKNEYISLEDWNTYSYADVEWGDWVSKDVIELKITKNNDNNMGTLIIKITVDEVESAVAIIESSLMP